MWRRRHRLLGLIIGFTLVGASCGDGGSGGSMSTAGLCDLIEDQVITFTGTGVDPNHGDVFVNDAGFALFHCIWQGAAGDATTHDVAVTYTEEPSFLGTDPDGRRDLAAVDADNVYSTGALLFRAPNGWTVFVSSVFLDFSDPLPADALETIGNAILDSIGPDG